MQKNRQYATFGLDQSMTDRLSLDESVVYGYSWEEGVGIRETVSPSLGLLLKNDLFSLDLGGSRYETLRNPGGAEWPITDTVELRWSSKWDMEKVPDLSFGLTQRSNKDDIGLTDNQIRNYNSSLDWDLGLVSINYNHSLAITTDNLRATESEYESQQARLSGAYGFWDGRLHLSFSQEFQDNNSEQQTRAGTGGAIISRSLSEARSGVDDPVNLLTELAVANPQLIDNNLVNSAYTIASNTINHTILMAVNGALAVNVVYLYAPDNWGGGVPPDLVNWRVYSTNSPTLTTPVAWNSVALNPVVTYDAANQRLVIPIPTVSPNYLKVVVDRNITALPVIDLAEVSVAEVTSAANGTLVQSPFGLTTNASRLDVKFRLSRGFMLNYGFSARREEDTNGRDNERLSNLLSVWYSSPDQTFSSSVSYGDTVATFSSSGNEQETKNFGLTINKNILPTLDVDASVSRHDLYEHGQRLNQNDQYNFNVNAQLYPDLASNVAVTHQLNKSFTNNDERETSGASLSLTSRLRPSFTLSFSERYEESTTNNIQTAESTISLLGWSWQLSEFLTNNVNVLSQNNKYEHNTYSFDTSVNVVLNHLMQVNIDYGWQDDETKVTQTGQVDWRWSIRRHLRLLVGANYFEQEGVAGNNIMFFSELSADFAFR